MLTGGLLALGGLGRGRPSSIKFYSYGTSLFFPFFYVCVCLARFFNSFDRSICRRDAFSPFFSFGRKTSFKVSLLFPQESKHFEVQMISIEATFV